MILAIDDLRIFEFECVYARTIHEAKLALSIQPKWDAVFWDHDLGGEDEVKAVFTEYLEPSWASGELDPTDLGLNYIVTDNPYGVQYLKRVFERWGAQHIVVSGQIPFRILGI